MQLPGQRFHLRLQVVGRSTRDRHIPLQNAGLKLRVDRGRRCAVLALEHSGRFLGHVLVAFVHEDVDHRLGANDLRGGGDQRDEAEILPHPGNLIEHFVEPVRGVLLAQLALQIR